MPVIYHQIAELQNVLKPLRAQHRIALVPTMGSLHDGHLELVKLAKMHADIVVVSIFVNPTQFGIGEDFDSYPRTLNSDVAKLATVGADYVFAPSIDEMYPVLPPPTTIRAGIITEQLCGKTRPTHFDGVGIVVSKLFNIVQPEVAIFGQKDYQQLAIINQLVRDLSYPIEIIAAPIVRAADGLALSSRNQYLTADERKTAPLLHAELQRLSKQLVALLMLNKPTNKGVNQLITDTSQRLTNVGFIIDYLEVKTVQLAAINAVLTDGVSIDDMSNDGVNNDAIVDQPLIIIVAAWLGRARLLDNQWVAVE